MTTLQQVAAPTTAARALAAHRKQALIHLCAIRAQQGHVPGSVVIEVAAQLEVHPEHLKKLIRQFRENEKVSERPGSTYKKCVLDEWQAKVQFFVNRGVASKTYEALMSAGHLPAGMSLRAFQRRVREWDPALLACAQGGYHAMVKHQFFNVEHIPFRAYAYGSDHTKLPIMVIPERGTKPIWPWLTTLIDLKTRVVLAYLLTEHVPNSTDSIDTLIEGVRGWYTAKGLFVGGKPQFLRTDRGGDYISEALTKNLMNLEMGRQFTEPYSSWQNGRVEALNGTIDQDFAPSIPGFHPGGEDEYTRRVLKTPIPVTSLVTLDVLDRRLGGFFGDFNNRPHSSLNGLTPLEAWAADEHRPDVAEKETIVNAMSVKETRRLHHYGIEVRGAIYSHPTLATLRKQHVSHVEVRFHAHDKHHIEVFVDGLWECTATKTTVQPEHHRLGVLSVRSAQRREMERLIRSADYERVLAEHARLREEGVDESEFPLLPPNPADDEDASAPETGMPDVADLTDVIDSALAFSDSPGAALSSTQVDALHERLSNLPVPADTDTNPLTVPDHTDTTQEGAA